VETARVTGLDADSVVSLAREYAQTRPTFIRLNYGMQRHAGGGSAVRAVSLLPALTGAWRDVGGGATLSTSGAFRGIAAAKLERPDWIPPGTRTINMIRLGEALTLPDAGVGGPPVKALIVYNSNPGAVAPERGRVCEGLRRKDLFTVVLEHFQTDTADYADWLLPATTQLEHFDVHKTYGHWYVLANNPAIAPLGQARPNADVFRELAARMGFDEPALRASDEDIVRDAMDWTAPQAGGVSLEQLRREGWTKMRHADAPFAQGGFPSPSG